MITAEEFLKKSNATGMAFNRDAIQETMIEFAKLHVKAALKAADEEAEVTVVDYNDSGFNLSPDAIYGVDSSSILNAYPLDLIK